MPPTTLICSSTHGENLRTKVEKGLMYPNEMVGNNDVGAEAAAEEAS